MRIQERRDKEDKQKTGQLRKQISEPVTVRESTESLDIEREEDLDINKLI